MNASPTARRWLTAITFAAPLAAACLGLWVASQKPPTAAPPAATSVAVPSAPGTPVLRNSGQGSPPRAAASSTAAGTAPRAEATPLTGGQMLDDLLSSSTDPDEVGLTVMLGFPSLPPETHAEAARQMVNLVPDGRFVGVLRILLDPDTSAQAKEIIFRDVMIRPDNVKLPALLGIMRQPDHSHASEARRALSTILDGDWGTDYEQWQARMDAELRRQAAAQ